MVGYRSVEWFLSGYNPNLENLKLDKKIISSYNTIYIYLEEIQVYVNEDRFSVDINISSCSRNYKGKGRIFYVDLAF